MFTRRESHKKSTRIILSLALMLVLAISMFAVPGAHLRAEESNEAATIIETTPPDGGTAGNAGTSGEGIPAAEGGETQQPSTFTVRFLGADDAVLAEHTEVAAGTALTPPVVTDFGFLGWDSEGYLDVQSDLEIRATFMQMAANGAGNGDVVVQNSNDYLSLAIAPNLSGAPAFAEVADGDYVWDYEKNYEFFAYVSIDATALASGRKVEINAPKNMRFADVQNIVGVTKSLSNGGQTMTLLPADSFRETITLQLRVYHAIGRDQLLMAIGADIKNASINGNPRPVYDVTVTYSEGGGLLQTKSLKLAPKEYARTDVFSDLYTLATYNSYVPTTNLTMTSLGTLNNTSALAGGGFHVYGINNPILHEPMWDIEVKIYLPVDTVTGNADIVTGNTALEVRNDNDGKGNYIYFPDFTKAPGVNGNVTAAMASARPCVYVADGTWAWRLYGVDLKLQLAQGVTPVSGRVYEGAKTEITYKTDAGTHTQEINGIKITTATFSNVDNYGLSYYTAQWVYPQDWSGSSADRAQDMTVFNLLAPGSSDINHLHVGGTLSLETAYGYEIYSITVPQATDVSYVIDGTSYTATNQGDGLFTLDQATPGRRAANITATFGNGLSIPNNSDYAYGVELRTLSNAVLNKDIYDTTLTVVLRGAGEDGCSAYNGQGRNPAITNGEHRRVIPVKLYAPKDTLRIQTYGATYFLYGNGTTRAFLDGVSAETAFSANIGFNYTNTSNATWMTYNNVQMNITGSRALETFSGYITMDARMQYTNASFEYTVMNATTGVSRSGSLAIPDSGNPFGGSLTAGTRQVVSLGLADDEYLTSLIFKAGALLVNGAENAAGISFTSRSHRYYMSDGARIPDYTEPDGYLPFVVDFTSDEVSAPRESYFVEYISGNSVHIWPVGFQRYRTTWFAGMGGTINSSGTVSQGATFTASVNCTVPNPTLVNSEVWLKLNPDFVYVGGDTVTWVQYHVSHYEYVQVPVEVRQLEDGTTLLIIKESEGIGKYGATYNISVMALPSAEVGAQNVFSDGWRQVTDMLKEETVEYLKEKPDYYYIPIETIRSSVPLLSDDNDLNGNGRTDDALVALKNNTTTVMLKNISGVQLTPGTGSAYSTSGTVTFKQGESQKLSCYGFIGAANNAVTDYETVFHIPSAGETIYFAGTSGEESKIAQFDLRLRGPAHLDTGDVSATVTYCIGGVYYAESAVAANGGWAAVTDVRVTIPNMPKQTTVGIRFDLRVPEADAANLTNNSVTYLSARYTYQLAGVNNNGRANLAAFTAQLYTLKGSYVFLDANNDNIFDTAVSSDDKKLSGVRVELYRAGADGKPGGDLVAAATTASDGSYSFTGLIADQYVIKVICPVGYNAFAAKGTAANASHVDANGIGPVIAVSGTADITVAQNAGLQARPVLTVEFRDDGELVGDAIVDNTVQLGQSCVIEPGVTAGYSLPEGYRIVAGTDTSKSTTISLTNLEPVLVFSIEEITWKVTFDDQGATKPVNPGEKTVGYFKPTLSQNGGLPDAPEKTGYSFGGWWSGTEGSGMQLLAATIISGDLTVYAKWIPNVYTVTFDANASGVTHLPDPVDLTYPDQYVNPMPSPTPSREGYKFDCWKDASGKIFSSDYKVEQSMTVYAQWIGPYFQMSFDLNGGTSAQPAAQTLLTGEKATKPSDPIRSGWTFLGWSAEPGGSAGKYWSFDSDKMPAYNVTLVAQWQPVPTPPEETVYYILSFSLNGGDGAAPASQRLEAGTRARAVAAPVRAGYTFDGWNTAPDGSGTIWNFLSTTMPARDVRLYAQWLPNGATTDPAPVDPEPTPPGPNPGPDPAEPAGPSDPGTIRVGNIEIALFGGDGNSWALFNMICSVAGVVVAMLTLISYFGGRRDEEEDNEQDRKKHLGLRFASIAVAVVSVIVFILTENMALPMVLVDRWTIVMLVLFGGTTLLSLLARDRSESQKKGQRVGGAGAFAGK